MACFISIVHVKNKIAEIFNIHAVTNASGNNVYVGDCLELDTRLYTILQDIDVIQNINSFKVDYFSSSDSSNLITFGASGKCVFDGNPTASAKTFIITNYESNQKFTKLIKCTPYFIPVVENNTNYIFDDYNSLNLPGYVCLIKKVNDNIDSYVAGMDYYDKAVTIDSQSNQEKITLSESSWDNHFTDSESFKIYSNYNLNYLSLVEDFNKRVTSKTNNGTTNTSIIIAKDSMNLSETYELKARYYDYIRNYYYPYDVKNNTKYDNTIRSSKLEGDESKTNLFKFKSTDYYNVPTDKGIIVNLVSVGDAILVHTEDSIYKFSGSNTLTSQGGEEVQMKETDVFETGIQELFGSEFGFAGLRYKHQQTLSENGYIFYDYDSKVIYMYSGQGQVTPISDDIDKLIKRETINNLTFANDYYNDRFFICIEFIDGTFATLSYNYRAKSFISLHDFKFNWSFHTKTKCYFVADNRTIYYVDNRISREQYGSLQENDILYPCKQNFEHYIYNKTGEVISIDAAGKACIVDILINSNYEIIKTLEFISWICSEIITFGDINVNKDIAEQFVAEEPTNKFAGDFIQIYTDSCSTNLIDLLKKVM